MVGAILIFGALLQRSSPHLGRWLMWLGASLLTLQIAVFVAPAIRGASSQLLRPGNSVVAVIFFVLCIGTVPLVGWCDVALIVDARRSRSNQPPGDAGFPRAADWLVAFIALSLTIYFAWGSVASLGPIRRNHRWDILAFNLPLLITIAAFDVAIVVHACKKFRPSATNS